MAGVPGPGETRIRPAGRGDLPAVVGLRRAVGWSSGGIEGSFVAAAAGRQAILVAELRGDVVGAVTVAFAPGLPAGCAHVSDLLVAPLWRRRGIGTQLLAAAEQEARRRGLYECTLDVDAHNDAAIALYLHTGYVHYRPARFPWGPGHTMRKELAPRPATQARPGLLGLLRWRLR